MRRRTDGFVLVLNVGGEVAKKKCVKDCACAATAQTITHINSAFVVEGEMRLDAE